MPREYTPRVDRTCAHCGAVFSVPAHRAQSARFCSKACRYAYRPPLEEMLWGDIDRADPDACWLWPGHIRGAYGVLTYKSKRQSTHRWAWELANGPVPDGLCVLHSCDVNYAPGDITYRRCVNPAHLWLGTNADNMADMAAKGRAATGERHSSRTHPERTARGERHGTVSHPETIRRGDAHHSRQQPDRVARGERHRNAVLVDAQVMELRARRAAGTILAVLARDYGISIAHASRIANGENWSHLE